MKRSEFKIPVFAALIALLIWSIDSYFAIDSTDSADIFSRLLSAAGSSEELFRRLVVSALIIAAGIHSSVMLRRRRQERDALEQSEQRFRLLFKEAPLPYQSLDESGCLLDVNEAWLSTLGYTRDRVIGKWFGGFLTPASAEKFKKEFELFKASGQSAQSEYESVREDGSTIAISFSGKIARDSHGRFSQTHCLFSDVTENRRAAELLRRQGEWLAVTLSSIGDAVIATDTSGSVTFMNRVAESLSGWQASQALGKPVGEIMCLLDIQTAQATVNPIEIALRERAPMTMTSHVVLRSREGKEYPIDDSAAPILNSDGELIGAVMVFRDVTERQRAEETVKRGEKFLQAVFDDIQDGISVLDPDLNIVRVNNAMEHWYAHKLPLAGRKCYDAYHGRETRCEVCPTVRAMETLKPQMSEVPLTGPAGPEGWLELFAFPMLDARGQCTGVIEYVRNITERKRAEGALRESEARNRALLNAIPDLMFLQSKEGVFLDYHAGDPDLLALSPDQFLGKSMFDLLPQGLTRMFASAFEKSLQSGEVQIMEYPLLLSGETRHFEARIVPCDSDRVMVIVRDITSRKEGEEALRESEAKYRLLFESAYDAIFIMKDELVVDCNNRAREVFGCGRKEIVGQPPHRFSPPRQPDGRDSKTSVLEKVKAAVSGEPQFFEWRHQKFDGTPFDAEVSLSRFEVSGELFVLAIVRNIDDRKRAEEKLRFTQFSVDRAKDLVFWITEDSQIHYANDAACERLGYSREGLLSLAVDKIDFDFTKEVWPEQWQELQKRGSLTVETALATKDGSVFPVEVALNYLEFKGRGYCFAFARDITARKESERALEKSLSLLQATLESTADGILVVDRVGKVCSFNQKFLQLWRIPEFLTVLADDNRLLSYVLDQLKEPEKFLDKVQRLYAKPEAQSYDILEFKDGRVFERYSQPQRIGEEIVGRVWSFRDISERTRAEVKLARLATAVEQAAEAIMITDADGTIEYVNPAFEHITGYTRNEVIGQNPRILKSGEHAPAFYEELWQTLKSGSAWSGRFRNRRKDGTLYEEEATISPLRDASGKIVNYVGVKKDVTQEAELEQRLRQAQKLEAVGLLAAGIAHDFNNLLAGIKGFGELVALESEPRSRLCDYAEEIVRAANRASDLTGQLLAFARKGNYLSIPVDVHCVINDVVSILEHSIDRRIEITKDLRAEVATVHGDPTQIQSAVLNLAVNARDAMPDGGVLRFETENRCFDEDFCHLHSLDLGAGQYLSVSVIDTGIGIEENNLARIFDPFFTTKEPGQGTGLGLAGVYGCVRNHHGAIEVASTPGEGSTFRLLLPVMPARPDESPEESRDSDLSGSEHLLVVEDEQMVSDLTVRMLTRAGYRVTSCADGAEAVELYRQRGYEFDLVLLDMIMPKMHGKDAYSAIRQINPQVKALLMSGYSDCDVQEIIDQGMIGFIAKPYQMKSLLRKVREALDKPTPVTHL